VAPATLGKRAPRGNKAGVAALPASLLQKIKRAKYPAVTAEEEAISIPLQTLCQVTPPPPG
jgi:hypothetical protein